MEGWWAASYVVLWIVVVALAVVVIALAREIGTLHLRLGPRGALEMDIEGPALGEVLPAEEVVTTEGRTVAVGGAGHPQLLLFVTPGCNMCEQVLPSIPTVAELEKLDAYVLTDVDRRETELVYGDRGLGVTLAAAQRAAQRYDIPGTPYLVVTDETGIVMAKGTVNNMEQVEGLVTSARKRKIRQNSDA